MTIMTKGTIVAALLWAGTALAQPTPQQACGSARVTAWKVYTSCIDGVVAKFTKGIDIDVYGAAAKCRHKYFKKWSGFQGKAKYAGSACDQTVAAIGGRFTDNGDQTVTDNLTGLTWEKKDDLGLTNDKDNTYSWSTGSPYKEDGTAFGPFLAALVFSGFGGANGWRLPTLAELQSIVLDYPCTSSSCTCGSNPCIDPALDAGNTKSAPYWSTTNDAEFWSGAWCVHFANGGALSQPKVITVFYARAVRGGL